MKRTSKQTAAGAFPIVGVGASAGGLEAFTALLRNLPADTGMGFVVVQHLDPVHESALTQLLAKETSMPVREVTDNLPVEPNHIYVIPPNAQMAIANGVLSLSARQAGGLQRTVDFFFEALAQDRRELAIGVILSGAAMDGTVGLEAIRAEGGITFAQDGSARYDSMPRSAVAANCADFVLPPEEIARELTRIARHPSVANGAHLGSSANPAPAATGGLSENAPVPRKNGLSEIIHLLRNHRGVDFSHYKGATILRRVNRRMVLKKMRTPREYARFLRGNADELDALYTDMLVNVTSFFRNPDTFDELRSKVLPALLERRRHDPLRFWVPGCSTGQEAYSLAIALVETRGSAERPRQAQIFATDISEALLQQARSGFYNKNLLTNLSQRQIRQFFDEDGTGYRVRRAIREMCIFARHNLISDPPFSRIDLVSCRNVLIYLDPTLQQKILSAFHYALAPGGFLLLGASESIGSVDGLFDTLDKKRKVFTRKDGPTPLFRLPMPSAVPEFGMDPAPANPADSPEKQDPQLAAQREADRVTVNQFAPPGVLMNAGLQILQFRGDSSAYLRQPIGRATFDLLRMARDDLMLPLRAVVNRAKKQLKPVHARDISISENGVARSVNIEVVPLRNLKELCYLILFGESPRQGEAAAAEARGPGAEGKARGKRLRARAVRVSEALRRIEKLERELGEARDYNQTLKEEHEAADEELQSQSEEVQSANEELQSMNEELEASKEELESTNEELTTVNEEMANRNVELARLNSDLNNFVVSIQTAVVVLGRDFVIRRLTPAAEKLFNLQAADVGRPFSAIKNNLDCPGLDRLIAEAIETVRMRELETRDMDGHWYSIRIRPYMTHDNKIDGAVVVATDIDQLKRSEGEIKVARDSAEAILRTIRYPLVILNADLRVRVANAAFYSTFHVSPSETEGRLFFDLGNGQWNVAKLRLFLEEILPRNSFFDDFEIIHDFENIGRRHMLLNARRLATDANAESKGVLIAIDDITASARLENVRISEAHYRRFFEQSKAGMLIVSALTQRIADANPAMTELLGYSREELLKKELWEVGLLADAQAAYGFFLQMEREDKIRIEPLAARNKAGEPVPLAMSGNRYEEGGRQNYQLLFSNVEQPRP